MNSARQRIPFLLVYSRIVSAGLFVLLYFADISYKNELIVGLLLLGIVTDFFDGVLARRWHVSSEKLRVWDSNADQVFWLSAIAVIFLLNLDFVKQHLFLIVLVLVIEALTYVVSYVRFQKPIATHSILAKLWTLTLLLFLIDLCLHHDSTWIHYICIGLGIVSRLEIVCIILLLKSWTTDVPSVMHVGRINRGEEIPKNKWLNS